jgi:hypothetical protein
LLFFSRRIPVDAQLKKAAEQVAQSVAGQGAQMQSDLLQQLRSVARVSQAQTAGEKTEAVGTVPDDRAAKLR